MRNKPGRIEALTKDIADFNAAGRFSFKQALHLRGRVLFARSVCYGRFGAGALRALNQAIAEAASARGVLSSHVRLHVRSALCNLASAVAAAPQKCLPIRHPTPIHVFTDGACEPAGGILEGTVGAVLIDYAHRRFEYIMARIDDDMMVKLGESSQNPICQVEALGVLAALFAWELALVDRPVVSWIDNEATRAALVCGYSAQRDLAKILEAITTKEVVIQASLWFERVPSAANVADAPSRGLPPLALPGLGAPVQLGMHAALGSWGLRERVPCTGAPLPPLL